MHGPGEDVATPRDWHIRRKYVLKRDGHRCTKCGGKAGLQVHHVEPRVVRHNHSVDNLVTLCVYCHSDEHSRDLVSAAGAARLQSLNRRKRTRIGTYSQHAARKSYVCDECHEPIAPGEIYYRARGKRDSFWQKRLCEECFLSL